MDNIIINALATYYDTLCKLGYVSYKDVYKLLVLCFYGNFVYHDTNALLSREDYREIEKALNCLYGTTCLIPYPDYLKVGKLHLGEITELAQRVSNLENTEVIKIVDGITPTESDITVTIQ